MINQRTYNPVELFLKDMKVGVKRDIIYPLNEVLQKLQQINWWDDFGYSFTISPDAKTIFKTDIRETEKNFLNQKKPKFKKP